MVHMKIIGNFVDIQVEYEIIKEDNEYVVIEKFEDTAYYEVEDGFMESETLTFQDEIGRGFKESIEAFKWLEKRCNNNISFLGFDIG